MQNILEINKRAGALDKLTKQKIVWHAPSGRANTQQTKHAGSPENDAAPPGND